MSVAEAVTERRLPCKWLLAVLELLPVSSASALLLFVSFVFVSLKVPALLREVSPVPP